MKILLIATIPLSLKAFSLDFMKFLRDNGHEVEAAAGAGAEAEIIKKEGFRYHEINISRNIDLIQDFEAFKSLKKLLVKENFDIVHTQTSKAGFIGRLAAHIANVPVTVHTAHNWAFHPLLPSVLWHFYLQLERIAAKWCDAIIVDTKAVQEYGLKFKAAPPEKINQVYMGLDVKKFCPNTSEERKNLRKEIGVGEDKIVIGCISRLVQDKGIETFLACAKELRDNENLKFVIVGDGELREQFERDTASAGIQDKVIFTGHLDDVVPYLNIFDIFCLPTLREGFGVVFAEAQACGIPVVATDIPVLKEVIEDGVTGILVPLGDVRGFVGAIEKLFDPDLRKNMGARAREHVKENFAIEHINEETLSLYNKLWQVANKG